MAAIDIERLPGLQAQKIVKERIARSGIASDQLAAVDIGHVGDAADIEDRDRRLGAEPPHQRLVKDRRERRALPAGRDIGSAKIIDHGNAKPLGQDAPVADLHRQPALRPVQQRLAVKADGRQIRRLQTIAVEERLHGFRMRVVHQILGSGDHARPGVAFGQVRRGGRSAAQQSALGLGIGAAGGGAEMRDLLAIGIDQRNIDAVLRGATHQSDRQNRRSD